MCNTFELQLKSSENNEHKIVNITFKEVDTLEKKPVKFMKMLFQFIKRSLEYGWPKM